MIKFTGIIMIFLASSAVGFFMSDSIKNKKIRLETERKMLEEISVMIRYNMLTVREMIIEIKENDFFSGLLFIEKIRQKLIEGISFPEAWEKSIKSDASLSTDEKKLLQELGSSLGTTDSQGQLSSLEIYKKRLDNMIESETEKYKTQGKLYRSLGIMMGAMLGILII